MDRRMIMLTKLEFRNFKRFESATVELGQPVVLAGPNNMGKTTALQALTLWDIGLRTWLAKRGPEKGEPEKDLELPSTVQIS